MPLRTVKHYKLFIFLLLLWQQPTDNETLVNARRRLPEQEHRKQSVGRLWPERIKVVFVVSVVFSFLLITYLSGKSLCKGNKKKGKSRFLL